MKARRGEQSLDGYEKKLKVDGFDLVADIVRYALKINKKASRIALPNMLTIMADRLGEWHAWNEFDDLGNELKDEVTAGKMDEVWPASDVDEASDLDSSNRISLDLLSLCLTKCRRLGIKPARIINRKSSSEWIELFIAWIDEYSAHYLWKIDEVREMLINSLPRGWDNPIFNGAIGMTMEGMMIKILPNNISECHRGTVFRPETSIVSSDGSGYGAGDGTVYVGDYDNEEEHDFTAYFPDSGTAKFGTELFDYTGKTLNSFTGVTKTGGGTTSAHADETFVSLTGDMSRILVHGAQLARRGWKQKPTTVNQLKDYEFEIGDGFESFYGQVTVKTVRGQVANGLFLNVCADNPGRGV